MTNTASGADAAPLVRLDVDGSVGTVRLDSPYNRNALSRRLRGELSARLRYAINDPKIRLIVLTHDGPAFCSGADLTEMRDRAADQPGDVTVADIIITLWRSPKPVIAVLRGPARAGGVGVAAACDIILATDTVSFAFTEVRIGVIPAVISVPLAARVQHTPLHEYFLTGQSFPARRAAEIGLVNAVAAEDEMSALVQQYVDMLLLGAPGALAGAKALVRPPDRMLPERLTELQALSLTHFSGPEGVEGMQAFLDKRPPAWAPPRSDRWDA
jgi:methylglutaconyl-CoA hydratase